MKKLFTVWSLVLVAVCCGAFLLSMFVGPQTIKAQQVKTGKLLTASDGTVICDCTAKETTCRCQYAEGEEPETNSN